MARDTRGIIGVGDPQAEIEVFIAVEGINELDGHLDKITAIPNVSSATVKRVHHDDPIYGCTIATVTVRTKDPAQLGLVENQLYMLLQQ